MRFPFSLILRSLVTVNTLNTLLQGGEARRREPIAAGLHEINLLIWANVLLIRPVKYMLLPPPSPECEYLYAGNIKYQAVCLHSWQNGCKDQQ